MTALLRDRWRLLREGLLFTDRAFPAVLTAGYALSFGLMVFIPARFWDDLQIFNNPDIVGMSRRSGILVGGIFLQAMVSLPHPDLMVRLLVLAVFLSSALLVRSLMTMLALADERERNAITLIMAVSPLFLSRFQIITSFYCAAFFLFCLGAWLLASALISGRPLLRLPAYLILLLAFYIESFLVLYAFLMLLLLLAMPGKKGSSFGDLRERSIALMRRAPEAFALPFLFFVLKTWLTPATAEFTGYNAVTAEGVLGALVAWPIRTLDALIAIPGIAPLWLLFVAPFLLALLAMLAPAGHPKALPVEDDAHPGWQGLLVSCIGAALAVFPYAVVSRAVSPYDFDDRNQLTLLLAVGPLLLFAVRTFVRPCLQWSVVAFVLCWCVAVNAVTYWTIIRDGHMQNAVVHAIAENSAVRSQSSFLVDTAGWPDLARRRTLSTAQLNCLMKDAFGDETRFAAALSSRPFDWRREQDFLMRYRNVGSCFRDWRGGMPELLTIQGDHLSFRQTVKLSLIQALMPARYGRALDGLSLVKVSLSPIPPGLIAASPR